MVCHMGNNARAMTPYGESKMSGKIFVLLLWWTMPDGQVLERQGGQFYDVQACIAKAEKVTPAGGLWYCKPGWRA